VLVVCHKNDAAAKRSAGLSASLVAEYKISNSFNERARRWTQLADSAVIGLSHLARIYADAETRSAAPSLGHGGRRIWRALL
jgi:hypothetical protein